MSSFLRTLASSLLTIAVFSSLVTAQWVDRDGLPAINPNSGLEMNPRIIYDPTSGLLSIDNAGSNGLVDSINNMTLQGDDIGMISIAFTLAPEFSRGLSRVLPFFVDGIAWTEQVWFADRVQMNGNAIAASFLPISADPVALMQLPLGLDASDFLGPSGALEMEIGVNHAFGTSGMTLFPVGDPVANGQFVVNPSNVSDGDFDGNRVWDCNDVDALVVEIASGNNDPAFDLNGDELINTEDLDRWLEQAGVINDPRPYGGQFPWHFLPGDGNLDGSVDASDFNIWNSNKLTATPAWCGGDFNADGFVDVSDFNVWNENKFRMSGEDDGVVAVPEPSGLATSLLCGFVGLLAVRRCKNDNLSASVTPPSRCSPAPRQHRQLQ